MFQLFSVPNQRTFGCPLILASASPRRREFLSTYGLEFKFFSPDVIEKHEPGESPAAYVQRNALLKAKDIAIRHEAFSKNALILASDTVVVSNSGVILEKPQNAEDAVAMLQSLSGKKHQVISSIVVCYGSQGKKIFSDVIETIVEFSEIPASWIAHYVATNDPLDKAGSYGIQGIAGAFVRRIEGSYTNVVGLPLNECLHLLQNLLTIRSFYLSLNSTSEQAVSPEQTNLLLLKKNKDSIIAISKKQKSHSIRFAYHFGQRHFGENYAQELAEKAGELKDLNDIVWHFTGSIQSNKIKDIARTAHAVHSVENLAKAQLLNKYCSEWNRTIDVFIKVATTANTQATGGCSESEAQNIAEYLRTASNLNFKGFMAMGPSDAKPDELLQIYIQIMLMGLKIWKGSAIATVNPLFSLGMSGDFHIACQAAEHLQIGAPMMRIGSAIFGER